MPSAGSCCERRFHRAARRCWESAMGSCPDAASLCLCLILAHSSRVAASPFRTALPSSTAPHFAAEALLETQLQQLSTTRLLPGRSACSWRRNGSKLTFDSTELPGAAATLATEHQHQQRAHLLRVDRLDWCRRPPLCSRRYGSRARGIFHSISAESARVACPGVPNYPSHSSSVASWLARAVSSLREAGVACLSITASRPKLHMQQHYR